MSNDITNSSNNNNHDSHNNQADNQPYIDKEVYAKLFSSEYGTDSDTRENADKNDTDFTSEEFQYQKYLTTPGLKHLWLTRDLELSYLKNTNEVSDFGDMISFVDEIYSLGAKKTALWFALQVYSLLALRVSINGFGRMEANPRRSKSEVVNREESVTSGWLSKFGKKR